MAGGYVQTMPDSSGKKVEAEILQVDTDTVARQVVKLADGREVLIAETLLQILAELKEMRRVVCEATDKNYNEQVEY